MSKTAAFTLSGLTVNNPNLPVLTPLVPGIQLRYRMAEAGESGTLTDSSPAGNDGIMNGAISVGDEGIVFSGVNGDYVDSGVTDASGDFTEILVVKPSKISAGVPMGNFELRGADNYRVGHNLLFTQSSSNNGAYSAAVAVQDPSNLSDHKNAALSFSDNAYSANQWCLCVLRHQPGQRRVSGFFKSLSNAAQVTYTSNLQYRPGGNLWIGQVQGGYQFSGVVGYAAFWNAYLDDEQVAAQVKAIRTDLARRGIEF